MSLDGVVEAPQNWHFPFISPDMQAEVNRQLFESDAFLYGRQAYEEFASFWPTFEGDELKEMADKLNTSQKYVVSTTLKTPSWGPATVISGDVVNEVRNLKQTPGGTIGMSGSPTLVQTLVPAGLIDELWIFLHPIVVGGGKKLFKDGTDSTTLTLASTKTFSGGVILLVYTPKLLSEYPS